MLDACAGAIDTAGAGPMLSLPQLQSADAPTQESNVQTVARVYLMELLVSLKCVHEFRERDERFFESHEQLVTISCKLFAVRSMHKRGATVPLLHQTAIPSPNRYHSCVDLNCALSIPPKRRIYT
jgi:hypothetical protein